MIENSDSKPDAAAGDVLPAVVVVAALGAALATAERLHGFGPAGLLLAVVLWLAVWILACLGAGRPIVDWAAADGASPVEHAVLSCVFGAGVLAGAAVVLSLLGWFRPLPLLAVLAVAAALGGLSLARRPLRPPKPDAPTMALGALWLVALAIAGTVTVFYDQWHQHLGFPWLWLRAGSIDVIPRNFYSYMPVNSSLMYAFGLGTLGPWSAQIIHWWAGVLTVIGCALLGRRAVSDGGGWWAGLIMATTPAAVHLAASGGSDLVVTMFAVAAWLCLLRTDGSHPLRWWGLAGAAAGLAAGTKYTALGTVVLPLAAAAIALHRPWRRGSSRLFLRGSATAVLGGVITFGPWLVRNVALTGAPLFPFMTSPFRRFLTVDENTLERFSGWLSGFDLDPSHVIAGLDLGSFTPPVGGFAPAGLLWLGCGVAALLVLPRLARPAATALLVGAATGIAFWLTGLHVVRYLLPALVPAAAVIGGGVALVIGAATPLVRRAVTALIAAAVAWNLTTMLHPIGLQRLGCTLGINDVTPLLARWVSSSLAFDEVAKLPAGAKILLVAESRALGFERDVELEHPFGESRLEELARCNASPQDMAAELAAEGVTHVLTNRWEARRISGMRRRPRYFTHGDAATMQRLDRFARTCLDPHWLGHGVAIYRLDPSCRSSGAGDLASW